MSADYAIPHRDRHAFTTYPKFRKFLDESYSAWKDGNGPQYIAAELIKPQVIASLDKNWRDLPEMRLHYNKSNEKLIVKFASKRHDLVVTEFREMFLEHCRSVGITRSDIKSIGTGRDEGTGRSKEPDDCFKPRNTRSGGDDKATLVVEAGLSETMNQLRSDAHHWLTKTNGEVHIVVLIHIRYDQRILELERWERQPNPRPVHGQNTHRPTCMQSLTLAMQPDGTPTLTGAPLVLPINLIFDVLPAHVPTTGLTFSVQELEFFVSEYFSISQ
ncbi:hypothetical protein VTN77DRAFT_1961 [Rasamsonia byssochlamydoides]|uniref:uncharacterized protein n=1 Tax=Rasamsonia byssochlamydoides TaxID=89139 RepID=UPI003742D117